MEAKEIEEEWENGFGQKGINRYLIGRMLGTGGFAKVYEIQREGGDEIQAVKVISKRELKSSKQKQKINSEINIQKTLRHPNILKIEHVFEDTNNIYILLELCSNQSMNELIKKRKRLTEFEVRVYLKKLVSAISYMHSKAIIHRDLKLGNLFLSECMELKVGDFGLAAKILTPDERRRSVCGTPNYIAPEIIEQRGHSYEVDLWSLGVLLFTLLTGQPPFDTKSVKSTYRLISQCKYSFSDEIPISPEAKDLVNNLLQLDPLKRLSVSMIFQHPFLTKSAILPELLPSSTVGCPPSSAFIRKYFPREKSPDQIITHPYQDKNSLLEKSLADPFQAVDINDEIFEKEFLIKRFVHTSKYGIGYLCKNGDFGVVFNDKTLLTHQHSSKKMLYIEKKPDKSRIGTLFEGEVYRFDLKKKYLVYHHFSNEVLGQKEEFTFQPREIVKSVQINVDTDGIHYVRRWLKSNYCFIFKIGKEIIQIIFNDETEIVINLAKNKLGLTTIRNSREIFDLKDAFSEKSAVLSKYMRHVQDIFTRFIDKNN